MKVRRADLGDVGGLVELGRLMCEESPVFSKYTPDWKKQYKTFGEMVLHPGYLVLVADDMSAMLIAHASEMLWFTDKIVVEDLFFVKREFRGTSRAVKLLMELTAWAKEQGAVEIQIGISTEVNVERTIGFYEKMGFRVSGAMMKKGV
jgi:GNAT superfamily N-acetyltransferase